MRARLPGRREISQTVHRRLITPLAGLSIGWAAFLSVLGLLLVALVVLWLTGRPSTTEWHQFGVEPMPWKDRLTYAGAVATAVGAVIALVVAYRKQRDAEEGRYATLFAEGAAQLGNPSPAVRIAGVYALAALADRYPPNRQQVIDALCGYLRLPYDPAAGRGHLTTRTTETRSRDDHERAPKVTTTESYRPEDREVRLTIIRLIRDHLRNPNEPTSWCGHDLDFTGAVFDGGDFTGAHFTGGTVWFARAEFSGGTAWFDRAEFSGGTVWFGAVFSGGTVWFGAVFSGGVVSFGGAVFSGGVVSFREATFSGGTVSFDRATFSGGMVSFHHAGFTGASVTFHWVRFIGGRISFTRAEFTAGQVRFNQARFNPGVVSFDEPPLNGDVVSFDGATGDVPPH